MMHFYKEEPIIKPSMMVKEKSIPSTVVLFWQNGFTHYVNKLQKERVATLSAGLMIYVDKTIYKDKEIAVVNIPLGAPVVAGIMEELHYLGAKNFVFVGSCGCLNSDIKEQIIVPNLALIDEGTSPHYLENSEEFVKIKTFETTRSILNELSISFVEGPTWTTDTIYRETPSGVNLAKEKGCVCVDMECSAIASVAKYLNVNAYQFFYRADSFSDKEWKIGRMKSITKDIYEAYLNIAFEIAHKVC